MSEDMRRSTEEIAQAIEEAGYQRVQPESALFALHHHVVIPEGAIQVFVRETWEDGRKLEMPELVSLLRWVADSLAGERVPMDYKLGQLWNEAERLKFDREQYIANCEKVERQRT
jgi:hypothetical protein